MIVDIHYYLILESYQFLKAYSATNRDKSILLIV